MSLKLTQLQRIQRMGLSDAQAELFEALREVAARGGPDVQESGRARGAEPDLAGMKLMMDLVERGLLSQHTIELSDGKPVHVVTAGEHSGLGPTLLQAAAKAWVAAGTALRWGTAAATELRLTQEIEALERKLSTAEYELHGLAVRALDLVFQMRHGNGNNVSDLRELERYAREVTEKRKRAV